jgi:arylsulfatase A-like enzyme
MNTYDTYIPPGPSRHHIEYWYQSVKDWHKDPHIYSNDATTIDGKEDGDLHRPKIYSPLNEANHIINYLNNSHGQRDANKPFSVFWALNPPHGPYSSINDCDEDAYIEYYKNQSIETLLNRPNVTTAVADDNVKFYFANVTGVDKQIGRVISALESTGLRDNRIIVFTSDHGEMMGSHNKMGKNNEFEESFGVPFLISYPAKLQHRIENLLLGSTDIMPTLLGLMGMNEIIPLTVQGTDHSELLLDPSTGDVTKSLSALYLTKNKNRGIRTDQYTFSVSSDGVVDKLFDNIADPYQLTNLDFSILPEAEQMFLLKELGNWLAKANDQCYQQRKFADFIIYPETSFVVESTTQIEFLDLHDNYPNPFNSTTQITVQVYKSSDVDLSIYNINGQLVKTLHNGFG